MSGALLQPYAGRSLRPPMAVIASRVDATVNTLNGALSSERRDIAPGTGRAREKTSNGPAKSRTSTSLKTKIPTASRSGLVTSSMVVARRSQGRSASNARVTHRLGGEWSDMHAKQCWPVDGSPGRHRFRSAPWALRHARLAFGVEPLPGGKEAAHIYHAPPYLAHRR